MQQRPISPHDGTIFQFQDREWRVNIHAVPQQAIDAEKAGAILLSGV
ncbi:MAG: hypothetical protein V3Q69_01205 [Burkholderia sp.]